MSRKTRICVMTGARADYGLLVPLMKAIRKDRRFELQVIAACMHLAPEFGLTYRQIEQDGFRIDEKVDMLLASDTPEGNARSVGLGTIGFAGALSRLDPDALVILGDRFEGLAAASAAIILRIPIVHLHGGELTEGAFDDFIRHAITKMSHLHFTSTDEYRQRVIQMGEDPSRVFNVGALGIDNIRSLKLLSKAETQKRLGFRFRKQNLLITYHPVTMKGGASLRHLDSFLEAMQRMPGLGLVFTVPNADSMGRAMMERIGSFVRENPGRAIVRASLGQLLYLSTMKHVDAVAGNSSSGIIETPAMGTPTVNIGSRQKGRVRAANIIDCGPSAGAVESAVRKALSAGFRKVAGRAQNPYGEGRAAEKIMAVLREAGLKKGGAAKRFHDIPFTD